MSAPEAPAAASGPTPVRHHDVGDLRLTSLVDVTGPFPVPFPAPFTGLTEAQWSAVRGDHPDSLGGEHWTAGRPRGVARPRRVIGPTC